MEKGLSSGAPAETPEIAGAIQLAEVSAEGNDRLDIDMLSGVDLAYIGDAVFELLIRERALREGSKRPEDLHKKVTDMVNAAAQARLSRRIEPLLSESEAAVFRRGRNSRLHSTAKNQSMSDYRRATGLEALVGWLYLKGRVGRIIELIEQ